MESPGNAPRAIGREFDLHAMRAVAGRASRLLGAMQNRVRLLILCQLVVREHSVNELAMRLDTRQSTISQHLALLRRDGLVTVRTEAQTRCYSLAGDEARAVLETLHSIFCTTPDEEH
ncbi:MAG: metalloregulator ArsR/SmtB family transcription factor [Woeseiaceae bacterium]|nr:metalloregulator ArsR/SmtB family transcription factor [Woeseiaceae bacterium]